MANASECLRGMSGRHRKTRAVEHLRKYGIAIADGIRDLLPIRFASHRFRGSTPAY
jgi:hypothetical protein